MKLMSRALAAVAAILLLATAVQAADLELYVRNRPFTGDTYTQKGRVFAPLDGVLEALGMSWRLTGERVDISKNPGGGPLLPSSMLSLVYEGQQLQLETIDRGGRAFVDVGALADAMKLSFTVNSQMGTADLSVPMGRGSVGGDWGKKPEPAASGDDQGGETAAGDGKAADGKAADGKKAGGKKGKSSGEMIETDGTNKESPIAVLETPFSDSTTPGATFVGEIRVSTKIKNTSTEDDLEKVKLHLKLVDGSGETVMEWTQDIGTLKAGQEYAFTPEPPVFYNYNQARVQPKVIVEHEALPEDEEEGADKPEGGK